MEFAAFKHRGFCSYFGGILFWVFVVCYAGTLVATVTPKPVPKKEYRAKYTVELIYQADPEFSLDPEAPSSIKIKELLDKSPDQWTDEDRRYQASWRANIGTALLEVKPSDDKRQFVFSTIHNVPAYDPSLAETAGERILSLEVLKASLCKGFSDDSGLLKTTQSSLLFWLCHKGEQRTVIMGRFSPNQHVTNISSPAGTKRSKSAMKWNEYSFSEYGEGRDPLESKTIDLRRHYRPVLFPNALFNGELFNTPAEPGEIIHVYAGHITDSPPYALISQISLGESYNTLPGREGLTVRMRTVELDFDLENDKSEIYSEYMPETLSAELFHGGTFEGEVYSMTMRYSLADLKPVAGVGGVTIVYTRTFTNEQEKILWNESPRSKYSQVITPVKKTVPAKGSTSSQEPEPEPGQEKEPEPSDSEASINALRQQALASQEQRKQMRKRRFSAITPVTAPAPVPQAKVIMSPPTQKPPRYRYPLRGARK